MNKLITEFYFLIGAVFSSILYYSDYVYNKTNIVTHLFTIYYTISYFIIKVVTLLLEKINKILNRYYYINNAH